MLSRKKNWTPKVKVLVIIIMKFDENNVLGNISIYINFGGSRGKGVTWSTLHFLFIIHKSEKVQEDDLYLNHILHHFVLKHFFLGWIIKKFGKGGPVGPLFLLNTEMARGAPSVFLFLYEVSIVVLIDFIAILLTPGIFLIQIVNKNMYLIHLINFYIKNNIKMHFPKSWVLKFQNRFRHSLSIATRWNKLRWH